MLIVNWNQDPSNAVNIVEERETNSKVSFSKVGDQNAYEGLSLTNLYNKKNHMFQLY